MAGYSPSLFFLFFANSWHCILLNAVKRMHMKPTIALGGGLLGACAITLIHESIKNVVPKAPRMDLLGMEAMARLMKKSGKMPPPPKKLYASAMAGDLLSNALYYSLAGIGAPKDVFTRGAALGIAAGLGALLLPQRAGLLAAPAYRSKASQSMTLGLYVLGGLAAAAAMHWLHRATKDKRQYQTHPYHDSLGMEAGVTYPQ
jgi:hypothetical protein